MELEAMGVLEHHSSHKVVPKLLFFGASPLEDDLHVQVLRRCPDSIPYRQEGMTLEEGSCGGFGCCGPDVEDLLGSLQGQQGRLGPDKRGPLVVNGGRV